MKLYGRQFFENNEKATFLVGVGKVLKKSQLDKVQLVRLSSKVKNGIEIIESMWGRPGRPPMGVFRRSLTLPLPKTTREFKYEDWVVLGQSIAEDMGNWVDNDDEFNTMERKAWAQQFDIWKTSQYWDIAQDLIDSLVYEEAERLGPLHWRVRLTLANFIMNLIQDVENSVIASLSEKENLDLLKKIIQKSELSTQPKPKAKATKKEKEVA